VPQVCATDVAGAVVAALVRPQSIGGTYTLAGPPTSPLEVVRTMRRLANRGPSWLVPVPVPVWVAWDTSSAQADLGFSPRSLEDALADVLQAEGVALASRRASDL
jgi:nucleoside-diphosphate-sugar epimerase